MFKRGAPRAAAREARRQQSEEELKARSKTSAQGGWNEDSTITKEDLQGADPLKITPGVGAEAKITGVARRITPEAVKPGGKKKGKPESDDDEPRRAVNMFISDEHAHFASMLNKRMERYSADPQAADDPGTRFGPNSSSQAWNNDAAKYGSGKGISNTPEVTNASRPQSSGRFETNNSEAVKNELKVLEQQGHNSRGFEQNERGQSDKALSVNVFQRAGVASTGLQAATVPPRSAPGSWRPFGESAAQFSGASSLPAASSSSQDGSVSKHRNSVGTDVPILYNGSKRGSAASNCSSDQSAPTSLSTRVYRRQPGREGVTANSPDSSRRNKVMPGLASTPRDSRTRGQVGAAILGSHGSNVLQALTAIDRSGSLRP